MILKDNTIKQLIKTINRTFGNEFFEIVDYWEESHSIAFKNRDKLIYISTEDLPSTYYFYECELLVDDPEVVYISQGYETSVPEEKLLDVISNYFKIKKLSSTIKKNGEPRELTTFLR